MLKQTPEIYYLLAEVEKKYGDRLSSTADFDHLAKVFKGAVSSATLKRLWGYVTSNPNPRVSTLDIMSKYVGFRTFANFCKEVHKLPSFRSDLDTAGYFASASFKLGAKVAVSWNPDCRMILRYLGASRYEILESNFPKLKPSDIFETSSFMLGSALYITRHISDDEYVPPFFIGEDGGIVSVQAL